MELRKRLDIWPIFIELTERRNLFVHTGGSISSQYITVCKKHNVAINHECKVGTYLDANRDYFDQSYDCLFELSTKLTQVMWRKLVPEEMKRADDHLNRICYSLLKKEQFDLAKELLTFACNLPRHSTLQRKLIFVVNNAIAHKWGGMPKEAAKFYPELIGVPVVMIFRSLWLPWKIDTAMLSRS